MSADQDQLLTLTLRPYNRDLVTSVRALWLQLHILPGRQVRLSRGEDGPFPDWLAALGVSRDHAIIGVDLNRRVWIQDNNSRLGTRINNIAIERGERLTVFDRDLITLGYYVIVVGYPESPDTHRLS
ncbi:FHA domain-containing protein [Nocardia heshunensis]